jgi:hypothetical protein
MLFIAAFSGVTPMPVAQIMTAEKTKTNTIVHNGRECVFYVSVAMSKVTPMPAK